MVVGGLDGGVTPKEKGICGGKRQYQYRESGEGVRVGGFA